MRNRKRVRRGKRKSSQGFEKSLRFMGVNSAGLKSKMTTFKKVLNDLQPSVFCIEETKYKETGKLKFENYVVFESVRGNGVAGGGLALGCLTDLNPAWVRDGGDAVEAISVDIFLRSMKIRCCAAYGPQENDAIANKEAFWQYLDEDVSAAKSGGAGYILHCDGNLWAGKGVIPGDPRPQNRNGQFFQEFLERNNLTAVNSLSICEGLITRRRIKDDITEESVLDFFVVCSLVLPFVTRMVIDEQKKHILTNYYPARKSGKAVDSDHFTEFMDLNLKFCKAKPERIELFNFKNKEGQEKFRISTSHTDEFTKCFTNEMPLLQQVESWRKNLRLHCKKSFQKIRIKRKSSKPINKNLAKLIDKRNMIIEDGSNSELNQLNTEIAMFEASEVRNQIMKNFKFYSENPENISLQKMWKLLKKLCPKSSPTLPTAKRNHKGQIISSPEGVKKLLANEYKNRLRTRPIRPDLKELNLRKKKIFQKKMRLAEGKRSNSWGMKDLEKALSDLKNDKSRDFEGYANKIFKKGVIGEDLKSSMLKMFNHLRNAKLIPSFMNFTNISTVPKRGSLLNPENERGIFRVSVIRYILMRLLYNDKYPIIDKNMSDCQMGGRKGKGCKSNIWIINGIIHEVLKSKNMKPIILQIYDYKQMFDSIDLEKALSDLYDFGVNDETLALLYKANHEIQMSVKTPSGLTERQTVKDIVLQGDTFGSILASVQVDSIGKEVMESDLGYLYKNKLPVALLGLVDDLIGVTDAGFKAVQMNEIINVKSAEKCLQFGVSKCKSMFVGKEKEKKSFLDLDLVVDKWDVEYKTDIITGEEEIIETFQGQIPIGRTTEQKYLGFVLSSIGNNMANINALKKKSIGIIKKITNKLESLSLMNYYFECSILFLNVMLRASLLYASECYYNLTEGQIRQIERIEESYLRQILRTGKGCPIVQIYLEVGQIPARFELQRLRLLFLKNILQQDKESMSYKFFYLQVEQPTRGDWASTCFNDLKELEISESLDDIRLMSKSKFNEMLKQQTRNNAYKYLIGKKRSKGKEISYSRIEMAEYLLPDNELTIEQKQRLFAVRNKMVEIPSHFSSGNNDFLCICGDKESLSHIYSCDVLNENESENIPYEKVYLNNVNEQTKILYKIEENLRKREKYIDVQTDVKRNQKEINGKKRKISEQPCDQEIDPLHCKKFSFG